MPSSFLWDAQTSPPWHIVMPSGGGIHSINDGHRRDILSPDFRDIGVGYAFQQASQYGHYWTQDFASPA
jgi:hypothetical protein